MNKMQSYDYAQLGKDKRVLKVLASYSNDQAKNSMDDTTTTLPSVVAPSNAPGAGIGSIIPMITSFMRRPTPPSAQNGAIDVQTDEYVLFSEECIKVNRKGKRQSRILLVTTDALYNFKPKQYTAPTRRIPLSAVEALLLGIENSKMMVFHVRDEYDYRYELAHRDQLVEIMKIAYKSMNKEDLTCLELPEPELEKIFVTKPQMKVIKETHAVSMRLVQKSLESIKKDNLADGTVSASAENGAPSPPPAVTVTNVTTTSPPVSAVTANGTATKDSPKPLPPARPQKSPVTTNVKGAATSEQKTKSTSPSIRSFFGIKTTQSQPSSTAAATQATTTPVSQYRPKCPPCTADLGVCNAVWSLIERALEPLNEVRAEGTVLSESEIELEAGLIRCADILIKLLGKNGPQSAGEAIRGIAALCFDHDAARALVKSMDDNIAILAGAALIDSLDALQRCEVAEVRKWAIKGLWKLLPMCMSENIMPTTSVKWMNALHGADNEGNDHANHGEAAFVSTYFRGPIIPPGEADYEESKSRRAQIQGKSKRPASKRGDRKGSFTIMAASFRNSKFPTGLSYLRVQQAYAQVFLQNMFDLQRRATYSHIAADGTVYENDEDDPKSPRFQTQTSEPYSNAFRGVEESDCDVAMEILLGSLVAPTEKDYDKRVDVLGKRIQNPCLLPTLMGMLALIQSDATRAIFLKEVSLLLLRSELNLQCVLTVPDWQMLFIPLLQTVPDDEMARSLDQHAVYKFALNLLIMIHTYCFKDPVCESGPLLYMIGSTIHCLALYAGWNSSTVAVARFVLLGLISQLSITGRHWWHNPDANEWEALLLVLRAIESFVFLLPGSDDIAQNEGNGNGHIPAQKKSAPNKILVEVAKANPPSESISSDNEDAESIHHLQSSGSIARAFSVTPLYVLYKYEPALKPLAPQIQLTNYQDDTCYLWLKERMGSGVLGENPLKADDLKKSSSQPGFGLHLAASNGMCVDRELLQKAIQLLRSQGITGIDADDEKKRNQNKSANKKHKGLLKQASERAASLKAIDVLLKGLEESAINNDDKLANETMERINKLIESRHKTNAKLTKVTVAKTKAVATKIEKSVLQQHGLVKQRLEKHKSAVKKTAKPEFTVKSTKVTTLKKARMYSMVPGNTRREELLKRQNTMGGRKESSISTMTAPFGMSNPYGKPPAALIGRSSQLNLTHARRTSQISTVARIRFYSSVAGIGSEVDADDDDDDESDVTGPPPPPMNSMPEVGSPADMNRPANTNGNSASAGADALKLAATHSNAANGTSSVIQMIRLDSSRSVKGVGIRKEDRYLEGICYGCGKSCDDDFEVIEKFNEIWHVDCFKCDQCGIALLKRENPNDILSFEDPDLMLFCSSTCREDMLEANKDSMCPYCMCSFVKDEKVTEACGRLWHSKHFRCTICRDLIGPKPKTEYFEIDGWPFCEPCHAERFRTCNKCHQPISEKDDAVDAIGFVWHRSHFGCFKCGVAFVDGQYFVDGKGDSRRAYCQKHYELLFESTQIKCEICKNVITEKDQAVEFAGKSYHLIKCFACTKCQKPLKAGDVNEESGRPYCAECWAIDFGFTCTGCSKPIKGDVLHTGDSEPWHPECFICPKCDGFLNGRYMLVTDASGKKIPMCEAHYFESQSKKCNFCRLPIEDPSESVEALNAHYHKRCLICHACTKPLIANGSLQLFPGPDGNVYCAEHENGQCALDGCHRPAWTDTAFFKSKKNGLYYCKEHRDEIDTGLDGDTCSRCFQPIRERGIRLLGNDKHYHKECFVCAECQQPFVNGEEYVEKNGEMVHKKKCQV